MIEEEMPHICHETISMSEQSKPDSTTPEPVCVAHALKHGDTIMEYVIERTLGGGGFGITYLARDENLNLPVAVKEYLPGEMALRAADNSVHALGDAFEDRFQWGLERFLAEARVLATFRHPNIVRVLRYFIVNGTGYIVMEYESGESLKHWLPRQPILTQASLLKILFPLLDGLEVIHSANYLHRDIKPDNIYIRDNGTPVLIDFGSARSTSTERELTNIVSPGFAPFEQYHSKGKQGPWTDLYSLAAVMYWLIARAKPLDSLSRLKQDSMVPATQLDHKGMFDEAVLKAIDWALNPEETHRPQSVAEFRRCLQEAAGAGQTAAVSDAQASISANLEAGALSSRITTGGEIPGGNLVCSVLFLDIVEYSKTSVNDQYELKSLFNQLIMEKLAHIPENTRITLDTGDGAAICFLGDPEEVLHAAIEINDALLRQKNLFVRMGLHIGPVRIINDLNGRSNVIGDGINVAQRVMSFADSNSLLVSRAFYEIVARLTDRSARSFEYLGERRDKHDRAHELYVVSSGGNVDTQSDKTILFNVVSNEKTVRWTEGVDAGASAVVADQDLTAGATKGGAGAMLHNLAQRAKAGIQDAWRVISNWSEKDYWWKLALAVLCACWAGWILGSTVLGVGLGISVLILGWANFLRRTNIMLTRNIPEESNGKWIFASATWNRQNLRTNFIVVAPAILVIAFLWGVLPTGAKHPNVEINPVVDANQPVSSVAVIDKPNAVQEPVQKISKQVPAEEGAEVQADLKQANKMLAEKNYKAAIQLSKAVLSQHPENTHAQKVLKQANAAVLKQEKTVALEKAKTEQKKKGWTLTPDQ